MPKIKPTRETDLIRVDKPIKTKVEARIAGKKETIGEFYDRAARMLLDMESINENGGPY